MRIAVIGLGAIGSQVLWQLSREPGVAVTGFESSYPGHPEAGAGGESRLYRNFELDDLAYEPVVERASSLWQELESASARRLRYPTGVLLVGCKSSPQMQRALRSAERSDKPSRLLAPEDVRAEYPQFSVADDDIGLWDPAGGVIRPEATVFTAVELASSNGAVVRDFTRVDAVEEEGSKVRIITADGVQVFDRVVIACGGWTTKLRTGLKEKVVVRRLTSAWFQADDDAYLEGLVPFMRTAPSYCYGIPTPGNSTVKLGLGFNDHHQVADPDTVPRTPEATEIEKFAWIIENVLPGLRRRPVRMSTYIESYTRSMHDYIDFDEHIPNALVLTGFSGHGFKVCPAIGEIGAQLAVHGTSDIDVTFLHEAPPVFDIVDPATGLTTHNDIVASKPTES